MIKMKSIPRNVKYQAVLLGDVSRCPYFRRDNNFDWTGILPGCYKINFPTGKTAA